MNKQRLGEILAQHGLLRELLETFHTEECEKALRACDRFLCGMEVAEEERGYGLNVIEDELNSDGVHIQHEYVNPGEVQVVPLPLFRALLAHWQEHLRGDLVFADGSLRRQEQYLAGSREGLWQEWHPNRQQRSKGQYIRGKREGLWEFWFESGQKERETSYTNGVLHGDHRYWYPHGQLSYVKTYEHGTNKDGKTDVGWHEDGSLRYELTFEGGQLTKRKNY